MVLDLAALARGALVPVVEHGNWRGRGSTGTFSPCGVVIHHTAGNNSLGVVINGRPGIPGPLANYLTTKDGAAHVIGGAKANDTGMGSGTVLAEVRQQIAPRATAGQRGLSDNTNGNPYFYDIEVENLGNSKDPYPEVQIETTVRVAAALCAIHGWSAARVIGHKEWTKRKIDPAPFGMDWFRARVHERLVGGPGSGGGGPMIPPSVMGRGDRGAAVEIWQRQLNDTQGEKLVVDGDFGAGTEAATKRFQAKMGLTPDGLVGPATIAAMERVYREVSTPVVEKTYEQAVVTTGSDFDSPLGAALARRYNWAHVPVGTRGATIRHAIAVGAAGSLAVAGSKTVLQGTGRLETALAVIDFAARLKPEEAARTGDPERPG